MRATQGTGSGPGPESSIRDIRRLRQTADFLVSNADQHRAMLVECMGLKRYVFNALGRIAHRSATGYRLLWPDRVETVDGEDVSLGEYLLAQAQEEHSLPQAVLTEGNEKYYL